MQTQHLWQLQQKAARKDADDGSCALSCVLALLYLNCSAAWWCSGRRRTGVKVSGRWNYGKFDLMDEEGPAQNDWRDGAVKTQAGAKMCA